MRVPLAPAVALGGLDQLLDLTLGQMLARSKLGIRRPPNGCDCPVYSCWRYQLETCFSHVISPLMMFNCRDTMWNTDSLRS